MTDHSDALRMALDRFGDQRWWDGHAPGTGVGALSTEASSRRQEVLKILRPASTERTGPGIKGMVDDLRAASHRVGRAQARVVSPTPAEERAEADARSALIAAVEAIRRERDLYRTQVGVRYGKAEERIDELTARAEHAESSERRLRERVEAKAKEWEARQPGGGGLYSLGWNDGRDQCAMEARSLLSEKEPGSQSSRGDAT